MSKQSLYEKILALVESGNIAITEHSFGYRIRNMVSKEYILCSSESGDIESCFLNFEEYANESDIKRLQENGAKYIGIYERPLWRPEVGDEVILLKKATEVKEMYGKTKDEYRYKDFIGNKCEVHLLGDYFCQIRIPGEGLFRVPYDCIAPRVSPDED